MPPWDIGRPQSEFVELARSRMIAGRVLDVGCGTGENALYFSSLGLDVTGIDKAPLAILKARQKTVERELGTKFEVGDALSLGRLKQRFDTITDCGLFHVFSDRDRVAYCRSLGTAIKPGGRYFMLCFSTLEPEDWGGPRRVSEDEIRSAFSIGWKVNYVRAARFESKFHEDGGRALLASISTTES